MIDKVNGIPCTWAWAMLDELGPITGGGTPKTSEPRFWRGGTIPWVSPKDMKSLEITDAQDKITKAAVAETSTRVVPAGTVLLVIRSGILQHTVPIGIATTDVALNQDIKGLTPHVELTPRYLAYALKANESEILHECCKNGTTVQSIEMPQLRRLSIAIAPSREQRRIADRLDELFTDLDAGVAALERVRRKLKRYRSAVLHAAVTGRLTAKWRQCRPLAPREVRYSQSEQPTLESGEQLLRRILIKRRRQWEARTLAKYEAAGRKPPKGWREKYPTPVEPKTDGLPELPDGWCWASVDMLLWDCGYGTSVKCDYNASGIPVLRIPNIAKGVLDLQDIKYSTLDLGLDEVDYLTTNDLLVCRTNGSIRLIGKSALVRSGFSAPTYFASYLIRLRFSDPIIASFLHTLFESPVGRRFVETNAASSAGQHNVSMSTLQQLPVPLAPLAEQAEIVESAQEKLSQIDAMEAEVERGLARAGRLRQAILKAAFAGRLVPQDASDEPAAALLERIRKRREAAGANGKAKRKEARRRAKK